MTGEHELTEADAQAIAQAFDALDGDLDRMDPKAHARLVTPISPELAQALERPELQRLADFYEERNAAAKSAQGWHFFSGRWAAILTAGAVLATLPHLFNGVGETWTTVRSVAVVLQGVFVVLAGAMSLYIYFSRPRTRWLAARSDAEAARRLYYETIAHLPLPLTESKALTTRLEFFRRFQMDTQRAYYAWKQPAAQKQARRNRRAYVAGLVLSAIAATPALLQSASLLAGTQLVTLSPTAAAILERAKTLVGQEDGAAVFAVFGVFATALLGLVAALGALDTSRRNAESYQENLRRLDAIAADDLAPARRAAREGNPAGVRAFVDLVDSALASEQGEWSVIGRAREDG